MITASFTTLQLTTDTSSISSDEARVIVPPADTDIEAAIEAVGPLADIPVAALDSAAGHPVRR